MADMETVELATRYAYKSLTSGVTETQSLELHSPYGCSKGVADQYTLDYARIFGINTVTLRQSCIYGPHQLGMEDQGWVSWFIIAAITKNPINIFGNGKQVRDILHVQDLVECYFKVIEHRDKSNGQAYNIGGGSKNTMSLLELLSMIKDNFKKLPALSWHPERPGDQIVYISNVDKAGRDLSWYPETGVEPGIQSLIAWIAQRDEHT